MSATINLTEVAIRTALRAYALSLLPAGVQVVKGRDNGVPMPVGPFAMLGSARITPWRTNVDSINTTTQTKSISVGATYTFQCDVYGSGAADNAVMLAMAFRDDYPSQFMPAGADAMYASDPLQIPFVDAEDNYEERWVIDLTVGYNPIIAIQSQSALDVDIVLSNVDIEYPRAAPPPIAPPTLGLLTLGASSLAVIPNPQTGTLGTNFALGLSLLDSSE
jgi:hypothetical protein